MIIIFYTHTHWQGAFQKGLGTIHVRERTGGIIPKENYCMLALSDKYLHLAMTKKKGGYIPLSNITFQGATVRCLR